MFKQTLKNFNKIKNKNLYKNVKSIEKTTANQTISREEKSKRMEKLQRTLELEIEKNHNKIFKPLSTGLLALKSNAMMKTLDQIYRPNAANHNLHNLNGHNNNDKYHSDKSRKISTNNIATGNFNKIYENKLSGRCSSSNLHKDKNKVPSIHNSKEYKNNPQNQINNEILI